MKAEGVHKRLLARHWSTFYDFISPAANED